MTGTLEMPIATAPSLPPSKWQCERQAFRRMFRDLLDTCRGKYVAIHEGRVVGVGTDIVAVAEAAYAQFGRQPIYVDLVDDTPREPIRFPHLRQPTVVE